MAETKTTDGPISRYINRKISKRISNYLIKHHPNTNPNTLTIIIFLISIIPFALFLLGKNILAGIIIQIASILDGVDGEVARKTGKTSSKGAILDALLDRIANTTIYLGIMIYLLKYTDTQVIQIIILGTLALSGDLLVSYIHSKFTEITGKHPATLKGFPNIASRDIRLFLLFLFSTINQLTVGLATIIVITYTYTLAKLHAIIKTL